MQNSISESQKNPPRLIPSLVEGFNAVAGNVYIILFPITVDLFLWFGPMIRVRNLLLPTLLRALDLSASTYGDESGLLKESAQQLWTVMLEGFNLLFGIRTFPIGVPSLMISQGAMNNPLGSLEVFELNSSNSAALLIILISVVGILLGSFYFSLIAAVANESQKKVAAANILKKALQSILLSVILLITIIAFGLPLMCLLSGILLFIPALGILPFTLFGIIMVWILLPFAFSPHGIFTDQLQATRSVVTSIKLVRSLMASSGMFLIMVILLSYGMDILWSTPSADSWMMAIGIGGHAFISSSLLAASFVYYRDGVRWLGGREKPHQIDTQKA